MTIRIIEIPSADMLRIIKKWEIEENPVVEALRGYAPERYGKDKPVCRKETLLKPIKIPPRISLGYKNHPCSPYKTAIY